LSIHTQVSAGLMLPLQGAWYTSFTADTVMSATAGLVRAKGTLIHWKHTHSNSVVGQSCVQWAQ